MIKTAIQLKAKVRNKSNGNDKIAKTMIRLFFMERFLERVSLSKYKEQFILKGGMLTASLLGIHVRATMDIDTTVRALPLIKEDMEKIIKEICELPLDDCIMFKIVRINLNIKIILLKISNILKCSPVYQRQFYASREKRLCQQ